MLEGQCDELVSQLDQKVKLLKSGAREVGEMIQEDVKNLNDIEKDYDNVSGFLQQTMGKFDKMMAKGGHKHMCYLACFVFVILIILYLLVKSRY
ncbi:hypothetical protein RFI_26315 [Reticulomyxa filosa]|uniref:t-SNARE coiled-coil homology domain-containing protein n=1 Tax=Reticulomyxa filosa TaxID=46433 RepID=X6MDD3_RETFI|nr:hypothetical protein RFI_26315 [Reticulomyxa filosa]|eukprot:ETO11060.1 hypothetical protein RFI_26315 [Reticulomyxa filosa]